MPALALFRPTILRGLPRDVRFVIRLVRATRQLNQRLAQSRGTFTTADYWAETVQKHSAKTALIFGGRSTSAWRRATGWRCCAPTGRSTSSAGWYAWIVNGVTA